MPEPKYTKSEIEAEIVKLDGTGFKCAIYYLKTELHRRCRSSLNRGKQIKHDTEKHQKWREASRKYRESKAARAEKV